MAGALPIHDPLERPEHAPECQVAQESADYGLGYNAIIFRFWTRQGSDVPTMLHTVGLSIDWKLRLASDGSNYLYL